MRHFFSVLMVLAVALLAGCASGEAADRDSASSGPPLERAQPTGGNCGGIVGFYCASEEDFCAMPQGTCRVADGMGVCTPARPFCTREYRPVCGCDGKTYGNACTAAAARVSVDYTGMCKGDARP